MAAISVIICVKDDWRVLRLLQSLAQQTLPADEFEAVVVTTGEDYGAHLEGFPFPVTRVGCPSPGLAAARNYGLAAARGEYFLTTDADCVAHPQLLAEILASFAAADDRTVGVGGAIRKYATDTLTRRHGITINDGQPGLSYLPASPLPYITGANAAFRTAAVRSLGGYDERFSCGEDVDVCYRLGLAGGRLGVNPLAVVFHEDRSSLWAHFKRFRWYAVDQALLFKLYADRRWHVNAYPWRRSADAALALLAGLPLLPARDRSGPARALVTFVEAAGVWAGDLAGSMRHRVLYI
jgi:GT2 family glycosyltransferase